MMGSSPFRTAVRILGHRLANHAVRYKSVANKGLPANAREALSWRNRELSTILARRPLSFTLMERERLDPEDANHGTWRLSYSATGRSDVGPGDLLYLRWKNPGELVDRVLAFYGCRGDERIWMDSFSSPMMPGSLEYMSLRRGLETRIDLKQAGRALLERAGFSREVRCNQEQEELHRRRYDNAGHDADEAVGVPRYREFPLLEILRHGSVSIPLPELLRLQDRIMPRAFSLSRLDQDREGRLEVDITVSELRKPWTMPDGSQILDAARAPGSLLGGAVGEEFEGWLLPDLHRFPWLLGRRVPVILVCTGTGISGALSVLRGGLQGGPLWLIYGVRDWEAKNLYGSELNAAFDSGKLHRFDVAESRSPQAGRPRRRVYDLLWEQRKGVAQWLRDGAHVFLIGRLDMGLDVTRVMVRILTDQGICTTQAAARSLIRQWKSQLRFQASVSGL